MNNWRKILSDLDPPPGFIPTNKGMFTSEDLVDELTHSSYAYNRDISDTLTSESWKKMINYGLHPISDKDVIERNNIKVDEMEKRYQRELSIGRRRYENTDDEKTGSWCEKLFWRQPSFEVILPGEPSPKKYSGGLIGELDITYDFLVSKLGPPTRNEADYKTDAEWLIYFSDEDKMAWIYNYKDGKNYLGEEGLEVEEITDWHVGGEKASLFKRIVEEVLEV